MHAPQSPQADKAQMIDLAPLLSVGNEPAWNNLLAALMRTDPATAREAIGLPPAGPDAGALLVEREAGKVDLLLSEAGDPPRPLAAIEGKLLDAFQAGQLGGHENVVTKRGGPASLAGFPLLVVALDDLLPSAAAVKDAAAGRREGAWQVVGWSTVLDPFTSSPHPWVRQTAQAWARYINEETRLPQPLDLADSWDARGTLDVRVAAALKMHELHKHAATRPGLRNLTRVKSQGGTWSLRLDIPVATTSASPPNQTAPRYTIRLDLDESASASELKDGKRSVPMFHLALHMTDPAGSKAAPAIHRFDAEHLRTLWLTFLADKPGSTRWSDLQLAVRPAKTTRAGVAALSAALLPAVPKEPLPGYAAMGYDDAAECWLGVRIDMWEPTTLSRVLDAFEELAGLAAQMAAHPRAATPVLGQEAP